MTQSKIPMTPALRVLKAAGVPFEVVTYAYEEKGGTAAAARELGEDEHRVVKTLVFEDDGGRLFIVLMHGDRQVSVKALARILGVKSVRPCDTKTADRLTGYQVGGISPFGIRTPLPVYWEETLAELPEILINAGKRGMLLRIGTRDAADVLKPKPVRAAV